MVTELINAVKAGEISAVQRMLAAGADVNSRDGDGATLLMLAAQEGDLPMVKALVTGKVISLAMELIPRITRAAVPPHQHSLFLKRNCQTLVVIQPI